MFQKVLKAYNLPVPVKEYQFHAERKWRFDFAWPEHKIALEIEGGVFGYKKKDGSRSKRGAHSSVTGILRDIEKYNAAAANGWRVLRVLPDDLMKTKTIELIKTTIHGKKG
jgi:very-short-patch-repair endonuclease